MKNRIIQAIWTKPMLNGPIPLQKQLLLAFASAKSIKNQNYELVLYTDKKDLFKGFPYDDIIEIDMSGINPSFFAAIKFLSLEKEPIGSVCLDYDVILTKPCIDLSFDKDLLVQCIELPVNYQAEMSFILNNHITEFIKKYKISEQQACCGVIGFFNEKLKNDFIYYYKESINLYNNIEIPIFTVLDLVFEQKYIYTLATEYNCKIDTVIPKDERLWIDCNSYISNNTVGYSHYWNASKWTSEIYNEYYKILNNEDIEICINNSKKYN